MNRFEGRRALVTGAASGIGRAVALRLHDEGCHVVAGDRSPVTITGERLTAAQFDVSDEAQVADAVGGLEPLDIVVNAAGILRASHTHETSLELWSQVIAVNLTGTFLVCREALPALCASGRGVICNFSSTSARFAHPYMAAYAASKGGIDSLTHTLAVEYASHGLRAFNVQPGGIESGMTEVIDELVPSDTDWGLFAKTEPLLAPKASGLAGPEVVANVVASLASDDGKWITATEIRIDGGAHG